MLGRLASCDVATGSVVLMGVLAPLLWHFYGIGHQKFMSGMFDMNQATTMMFLIEPHNALRAEPGLVPLLPPPLEETRSNLSSSLVWLQLQSFMKVSLYGSTGQPAWASELIESIGLTEDWSLTCGPCALQWGHHIAALAAGVRPSGDSNHRWTRMFQHAGYRSASMR